MIRQITRAAVTLIILLSGCAHDKILVVKTAPFQAPRLERELNFFVSNYSTYPTNRFYVGPTKIDKGELVSAWVYWKEGRMLLTYEELSSDAAEGAEALAWTGHDLKLDRDTIDTPADIGGSSYLETHHQWVNWMEQCIQKGKAYCVLRKDAQRVFPKNSLEKK